MALQPGVGVGLLYNMPPSLSIPCSVSPFIYSHLSQVCGHVIQPSHFWSSSSSCCIQLSVQHLFLGLRCLAFFLHDQACFITGLTNVLPIVFEVFMALNIFKVLFSFKRNTRAHYFLNSSTHILFSISLVSLSVISTPPNFLLFHNHVLVLVYYT